MVHTIAIGQDLLDAQGLLAQRLDAQPGTAYLIRPDQHICARWRAPSAADVQSALARALAQPPKDGH
jgi:3-(3-hydroxy-phenyl)propionate hydroxylase